MDAQLRAELQNTLSSIGASAPVFTSSAATDRLYEGFVLSIVIRALLRIGARLQVYSGGTRPVPSSQINLRRAPGRIYGNSTDAGFILVEYEGNHYELHTDLRVAGTSGVLHELDITIVDHGHAHSCRTQSVDPNGSKTRFICECKCYGSSLPLSIGREFLGLGTEFTCRAKTIASNSTSASIVTLAKAHKKITQFSLDPNHPDKVDSFIGWLAKEMEHVL